MPQAQSAGPAENQPSAGIRFRLRLLENSMSRQFRGIAQQTKKHRRKKPALPAVLGRACLCRQVWPQGEVLARATKSRFQIRKQLQPGSTPRRIRPPWRTELKPVRHAAPRDLLRWLAALPPCFPATRNNGASQAGFQAYSQQLYSRAPGWLAGVHSLS